MQLKIERIIWNEVEEHPDIKITEYVYTNTLIKISRALRNKKYTEITFDNGEVITINEQVDKFKKRVDKFIKDEEEKGSEGIGFRAPRRSENLQ